MNTASLARRYTTLTVVASLFAAAALASLPAVADTLPAASRAEARAEQERARTASAVDAQAAVARPAKAEAAAPAPTDKARTSGLTRDEVKAELQRARASGEVQQGGFEGPFFERSTVRRSIGE
jgi:hypothetical protein